jgi:hypothetical protein
MITPTAQPASNGHWHDADDLRWAARHSASRMSVPLRQVHIRAMRNKWASMSTAGRLTLNAELPDVPVRLGEYVIVHELVHLLASNHGKVVQSFMYAYMPDREERGKALQTAGCGSGPDSSGAPAGGRNLSQAPALAKGRPGPCARNLPVV